MIHEKGTFGTNHHNFVVDRRNMNQLLDALNELAEETDYPVQISINGGITNFKEKRDLLYFILGVSVGFDVTYD